MANDRERDIIRDPKRLRALSHPLRWKLINLIGDEDTATATRCAEVLGESVASCSYHLNMLAKYGFVEQAEGGQGREKPWKLTSVDQSFGSDELDTESQLAAEAAGDAFLDYEFEAMRSRIKRRSTEPAEWRPATGIAAATLYLTLDEAQELRDKIVELVDRHIDRMDHPELRPEGARQLRVFTAMFLNPERR
jgi:predicted ArsR family transcriptional regulator